MTHAAVYAASSGLRCVLHVHDPSFWRAALLNRPDNLGLVEAGIPYGTPAMSHAISAIASTTRFSGAIMAGHDDGWLVWAATPAEALERLDGLRAGFGLRAWAGWPRSRR
jgi:ribulose-5-phosphate 4-epimerase/fuculose-1-phosphate aldolase